MTIIHHEGELQVTCNACPLTYRHTYAEEDFHILVEEIKVEGWKIERKGAELQHTCPDCAKWAARRLI
nr:hypothetical protein RKHAN_01166 [Rhizobium sp. Khangiran2]